jgi:hypothetical protein
MKKEMISLTFGDTGLNTDLQPWSLPGGFLTNLNNVRIESGKIKPFGGHSVWATLPVDFTVGQIIFVNSTQGEFWLLLGLDAVKVYDGATFTDISNVAGYTGIAEEDLWTGCMLSNIPVVNHPGIYPEYWPTQTPATKLEYLPWDATNTWADVSESCRIIRSHKQFLFALDLQSGATEIPDGVRWSAPADINGVPPTWDHLDITNVAGLTTLGGVGGRIVDGLSLRDAFVVYREKSITVFDYVGGQFVWQIRNQTTTNGLIAPDAIVEVRGVHYFIGNGDVLANDGNSIQSLMHNRIRSKFATNQNAATSENSYATINDVRSEIWFCVPEAGNEYPNVAYIYNWEDQSWTVREIPQSPYSAVGKQATPQLTWADLSDPWDDLVGNWNQGQSSPSGDAVIAASKPPGAGQSGELLLLDFSTVQVTAYDALIERISFALGSVSKVTTITKVFPHISGTGDVWIQLGSQDYPGSPTRWKPAVLFNPTTDRKVDIRTTGELHSYRIFSNSAETTGWEISGLDIEFVHAGQR